MRLTTRAAMDRVMDGHFKFEAAEDVESRLGTVTDDVLHDQVGNPMGPREGKPNDRILGSVVRRH